MEKPSITSPVPLPLKNALVLDENKLHYLVLVHHVDCNVARLGLRPQQRGSKHDGHALGGHAVGLAVVNHPVGVGENTRQESNVERFFFVWLVGFFFLI